jgi:hypothetical protein
MLVYLRESSLRRNDKGITTSLVICQERGENITVQYMLT